MTDSNAIFGSTLSIWMLDQFSRRRKMRLERAYLMQPGTKRFELFLEVTVVQRMTNCKFYRWSSFELLEFLKKQSSNRLMPGCIRCARSRHIFLCDRIDLASKLRELNQKWRRSRSFSFKNPLTNFQTLAHQISLLTSVDTLISFFLYKTQKQTIFCHSSPF